MTGQVTSLGLARWAPAEWRAFAAFLRRPVLPDRAAGPPSRALGATLRLFGLDLVLMALLIGLLGGLTALGFETPDHLLDGLELTPALLAFIVLGAPIGEELVFRGWLSGRPGALGALLALLAAGVLAGTASLLAPQAASVWLTRGFLIAGLVLALVLLWLKRGRPAVPWFQRHFRWFYFGSALAFASVHLTNFGDSAAASLLPLTLPQFVIALVLGYLRVTYGLWTSMLLHLMHNGLFIGLVLAGAG